ncbi:MbcA/ParS/Xre antitoxin family protein [Massilia putida]|uniref:MbcA/ParS/Xre antitoxin family protein n=1 Tax=Massilia putida TaxID=1141883 RepID=UPI0014763697|nr:MbcA/ParS/Xre antitoxin family protein [Massilia putida]
MDARSRKKMLYRRLFRSSARNTLAAKIAIAEDAKNWHLIKPNLLRLFGNDGPAAWSWYVTPALALNGKRPADLVLGGDVTLVQELLIRLEYGVYT